MNKAKRRRVLLFLCLCCYAAAILCSRAGLDPAAGLSLAAGAAGIYLICYRSTGDLLDPAGLFGLFWVGGQGIACLKLSYLAGEWTFVTWSCFALSTACFLVGSECLAGKHEKAAKGLEVSAETLLLRIRISMWAVLLVSLACFVLEAVILGFVPLFSPEPHAYSYFHISGVHYFTVSCVLVPPLAVLYRQEKKRRLGEGLTPGELLELAAASALAFAVPLLCVSRFQLILSAALAVLMYVQLSEKIRLPYLVGIFLALAAGYVLLTFARRHDVTYLNGIFEMKQENMPIFITQPYMYIANNFDNFNCLVERLPAYTWGLRQLFPVIALTGLKFLRPELAAFPIYVTKKELTTVSLIYDAYYDFGVVGVILFAFLLGFLCRAAVRWIRRTDHPIGKLFYGQLAMYLILSFFTTWFSNPTTWFWFAVTLVLGLFVGRKERKEE